MARRGRYKDTGNPTQGDLTNLDSKGRLSLRAGLDAQPPHSRFAQSGDRQERKPKLPATVPRNRANGAAGRNRSRSIAWIAKQENFRPSEAYFFLTAAFYRTSRDFILVNSLQILTTRKSKCFVLIYSLFLDPNSQSTSAAMNCSLAMNSPTISHREPPHIETIRTPM
jgi:hypothetical protein